MKVREINKRIAAKMEDWLASLPDELAKAIRPDIIVTGGAITSMLLKERVNDYDVYFKNKSSIFRVLAHYGSTHNFDHDCKALVTVKTTTNLENLKSMGGMCGEAEDPFEEGVQIIAEIGSPLWNYLAYSTNAGYRLVKRVQAFVSAPIGVDTAIATDDLDEAETAAEDKQDGEQEGTSKYQVTYLSTNAISLSGSVQLILRFFGDAEEIHKNYDFVHATNYWTFDSGLVTNTKALEATLARELVYSGSRYPLASIFRTRKFIRRGWTIHIGNYVKMAMQLNEMDLRNIHVLREQLTGVDALYLQKIIKVVSEGTTPDGQIRYSMQDICDICDKLIGGAEGLRDD